MYEEWRQQGQSEFVDNGLHNLHEILRLNGGGEGGGPAISDGNGDGSDLDVVDANDDFAVTRCVLREANGV